MAAFDCPHCNEHFTSFGDDENNIVVCPHCNGMVALPGDQLPPGAIVGKFEIIRLLGKGGMGNVYLARQASMDRLVALKILSDNLTRDKQAIEQFFREVHLSGQLNHPNVVAAIDAGEDNGTYYLAMAYIEGQDLEDYLHHYGTLKEAEAIEIALKIGDALDYAWQRHGLMHKDIKPGNIMIDQAGEVYLMDMGIAQLVGEHRQDDELVVGSPFYMSPEQARADSLGWQSDLYSLGATLYHLLVGLPPYDAEDVTRIMEMHSSTPFPEPEERKPGCSLNEATVKLLRRMMEKEIEDRFVTWDHFMECARDLLETLRGGKKKVQATQRTRSAKKSGKLKKSTILTKPASPGYRNASPAKTTGGGNSAIIISFSLLIVIGILAAFLIFRYRKNAQAKKALDDAENYLRNNPAEVEYAAKTLFPNAGRVAQGTAYEEQCRRRQEEVLLMLEDYRREIVAFDDAFLRAKNLCKQKQYQEAIDLLNQNLDVSDEQKRKEAEMFIHMIRQTINAKQE